MSETNTSPPIVLAVSAPPFWHNGCTIHKQSYNTIIALIPIVFMAVWTWGLPAARVIALACVTGILTEAICQKIMERELDIDDFSSLIACCIFAFLLPAATPWWVVILGAILTITLGKMVFGGLGANPVNTSLIGWAMLYVSWPTLVDPNAMQLSTDFIDPLIKLKYFGVAGIHTVTFSDLLLGKQIGGLGASQAGAILLGGIYLILQGIIRWEISLSFFIGVLCTAAIFNSYNPEIYASPFFHLLTGSTLLGGFFIATEYASSPHRRLPMIIYGLIGGSMVIIIRVYGIYSDGVPFAILLINLLTPILNMIRPKPFGKKR